MNILREIRRISQKSKRKRIILIVLLCVTLLSSSYAWFAATKTTTLNGLSGQVNSWDVAYVISDTEVIDKEVSFDLSTIYPTMPTYEQNLHIYNLGEKGANIKLEIISVKLFGEEILDSLKEKSMYNTDIDVNSNDTILTLSTCDYSVDDGRFVVQAKLVK